MPLQEPSRFSIKYEFKSIQQIKEQSKNYQDVIGIITDVVETNNSMKLHIVDKTGEIDIDLLCHYDIMQIATNNICAFKGCYKVNDYLVPAIIQINPDCLEAQSLFKWWKTQKKTEVEGIDDIILYSDQEMIKLFNMLNIN